MSLSNSVTRRLVYHPRLYRQGVTLYGGSGAAGVLKL